MLIQEALNLIKELLQEHNLSHIPVKLNNSKKRLAYARFDSLCNPLYISLSVIYISNHNVDHVKDTILHEIAHFIAGYKAGHGPVWKSVAKRIGASPNRLSKDCKMPLGRYRGFCKECGIFILSRHRVSYKMFNLQHVKDKGKIVWYDFTEKKWIKKDEVGFKKNKCHSW